MTIEQPGLTLDIPESFSPTQELDSGYGSSDGDHFDSSSLNEMEHELQHDDKQIDKSIEKMLAFEENEIAQLTGNAPSSGSGTGMPGGKGKGHGHAQGHQSVPQGAHGFGTSHSRDMPTSDSGTPTWGSTEGSPKNDHGKVTKSSPSSSSSSSTSGTPLVKGQYTSSDLGTLPPALQPYRADILNAANKSGVPPNVLAAQIYQESRGQVNAGSTNQATGLTDAGLMQVDPATFQSLRQEHPDLGSDLSDPATNILAGAYYDEDMYKQFGSIPLMLRAYNSGPDGVDKSNPNAIPAGVGDPNYVTLVMQYANDIQVGKALPA
ncbi:lytic transglycosylase domain-containing protein [Trinickia acidisoli]|uniref:lytic transglycosylase domain-containing protein n=1 Tax=Trinickia acidisoli TaxID=2767482 RepID=UPI001A8CD761|nr:lytic transglycosylase domain-containing protein [Trinickia acidisoli]